MQSRKKRQTFAILFIQSRKLRKRNTSSVRSNCIVKFITSTLFFESSTHIFQNYYSFFLTIPSSFLVEIKSRPGRLHDAYKWNNYKPIVAPLRKGRIYLIICIDDLVIVLELISLIYEESVARLLPTRDDIRGTEWNSSLTDIWVRDLTNVIHGYTWITEW